jgi:hypothetical protein
VNQSVNSSALRWSVSSLGEEACELRHRPAVPGLAHKRVDLVWSPALNSRQVYKTRQLTNTRATGIGAFNFTPLKVLPPLLFRWVNFEKKCDSSARAHDGRHARRRRLSMPVEIGAEWRRARSQSESRLRVGAVRRIGDAVQCRRGCQCRRWHQRGKWRSRASGLRLRAQKLHSKNSSSSLRLLSNCQSQ